MGTVTGMAALQYIENGLSCIPIRADGSKAPALVSWKPYQRYRPSEKEIQSWFRHQAIGVAIVTGTVSGSLEVIDFDAPELFAPWSDLVDSLCPGLIERLVIVRTPSSGYHVYIRSPAVECNLKLAQRAVGVPEGTPGAHRHGDSYFVLKTLIETRGEGGYVIAPPSPAGCHLLGKMYELVAGRLTDIPLLSRQQREALFSVARSFNEYVERGSVRGNGHRKRTVQDLQCQRPGDDYNQRADWESLLCPHGWTFVGKRGEVGLWRRPGKYGPGISATTNFGDSNLLYVFSTNCTPFEPVHAYTLFAAFGLLFHSGNFRAAARVLAAEGYGRRRGQSKCEATTFTGTPPFSLSLKCGPPAQPQEVLRLPAPKMPSLVNRLFNEAVK